MQHYTEFETSYQHLHTDWVIYNYCFENSRENNQNLPALQMISKTLFTS